MSVINMNHLKITYLNIENFQDLSWLKHDYKIYHYKLTCEMRDYEGSLLSQALQVLPENLILNQAHTLTFSTKSHNLLVDSSTQIKVTSTAKAPFGIESKAR